MPDRRERTYDWSDPATIASRLAETSGYEGLRELVTGELPPPPIGATLDMHLTEVGEGTARFEMTPGEHHLNPMGAVHGGVALTLIDSATGVAVHTLLPQGVGYTTVDVSVSMVRAIRPGVPLVCTGQVLHRGRRIMTARADLCDDEGRLYAHGTATCMVLRPPGTQGAAPEPRH